MKAVVKLPPQFFRVPSLGFNLGHWIISFFIQRSRLPSAATTDRQCPEGATGQDLKPALQ